MAERARPAYETWDRIAPMLTSLGITRVGDITGLDRIGIPVWIAVRPNSRTLSVSQGKGLDSWAARVSAAMESIENALAERPRLTLEFATYAELSGRERVVDIAALPRPRVSLFGSKRPLFWTEATDWTTRAAVWVPYELVYADATVPWLPGSGSFLTSTNGLASGNNLDEAVLHGLCEVIERDALSLWDHFPREQREARRLDLGSIDAPIIIALLDRFRAANIRPIVWDVTSDIAIAAFRAVIHDEEADAVSRPFPAAFGAGCHPDRAVAIARALTEAAQSRLTVIAGSRDDFGRKRYAETQSAAALAFHRELAARDGTRRFDSAPHFGATTQAEEIDHVARQLTAAGFQRILYLELADTALPIRVARVIVPGLEGPTEAVNYYPGRRVRALLAAGHA